MWERSKAHCSSQIKSPLFAITEQDRRTHKNTSHRAHLSLSQRVPWRNFFHSRNREMLIGVRRFSCRGASVLVQCMQSWPWVALCARRPRLRDAEMQISERPGHYFQTNRPTHRRNMHGTDASRSVLMACLCNDATFYHTGLMEQYQFSSCTRMPRLMVCAIFLAHTGSCYQERRRTLGCISNVEIARKSLFPGENKEMAQCQNCIRWLWFHFSSNVFFLQRLYSNPVKYFSSQENFCYVI